MRQVICNYRTDEELVSPPGSAFIAINLLNFRRSFIIGKKYLGSSASWAMARRCWPSQPSFSAIYMIRRKINGAVKFVCV